MAPWLLPQTAGRPTSQTFYSFRAWARAPCSPSPWSRRSSTAHPAVFADPARFSFAHGGKDRHPYPVPTKVYDKTISVLKSAISAARLGNEERPGAIQRLDREARRLERFVSGPPLHDIVANDAAERFAVS